ncbi:hypothetical protein L9F63_020873 [Diploptera punctata]|uniref:FXNA-like protease n=1 Tax=Diploptera punctata TaxID=6984 RepID=A0AAD8EBW9_DIPPU|nr:hypothetical protein L9F63_020873 [Diploptera punctata]
MADVYNEEKGIRLRVHNGEYEDTTDVRSPEERRHIKKHANIHLPTYVALLVVFCGIIFFGLAYFLQYRIPKPLLIKDIETYPNQFIAERALNHLRQLVSFGSKPVGSYENEVLAVEFITREVRFIMQRANPAQKISFDIQKCTGSYTLKFKPHGLTNYYSQVQNIVVKLGSNSSSSLLINCHFDSVPTSPGGSDDGLNCAVMLEVLEILSRSDKPLKHNVIFLFNGAEESPLQASHGFITQHKWAHEIKAFINLEACGAGGREILFQAGPNHPWLVQSYSDSVPHPHGSVVGEELFQSGIIPSDTDFRIFRDFGKIPGLDFAHSTNGYVYHTSYDGLHAIPIGTIQHTGDNLLALTKHLASSEILSNTKDYAEGKCIYFDIMGIYFVRYSELAGTILNLILVLISAYTSVKNLLIVKKGIANAELWKLFILACGVPVLGWIIAFLSVLITAVLLDAFNSSMSWFTRPSLILFLYYCPVLVSCMILPILFNRHHIKKNPIKTGLQGQLFMNGVQLLWTGLLLGGSIFSIRSTFAIMLVVLFPSLSSLFISMSRWRENTKVWLGAYISSTIPFTFFAQYLTITAMSLFVPMTGRIGASKNPDIIIGLFAALLCILSSSYITQVIVLIRSPWKIVGPLCGLYVVTVLAVILTPLGFPYSANPSAPTPQRIHVYHTERIFHDILGHVRHQDSGYWLMNLDRHSPDSVISLIPEIADGQSVKNMCEKELACGLPHFTARSLQISENTHWIPAPAPPVVHQPTNLDASKSSLNPAYERIHCSLQTISPDRMTVLLSPVAKLTDWSFGKEAEESGYEWQNRPTYYINYVQGLTGSPFEFWINLEVTEKSQNSILEIAVIGHYINNQGEISEHFRQFLRKYPDWAHVTAWPATYKSWSL